MKKIILGGIVLLMGISLVGCGKSTELKLPMQSGVTKSDVVQPENKNAVNVSNYEFAKNSKGEVDIMKESLKIQTSKTLSKEEKSALLIKLQEINREQLNKVMEK